ncbi:MAG: ABC transporter permease [Planctomycetes bacterium]|nr:ABC transporter permease [Planctomycetota bacterium]
MLMLWTTLKIAAGSLWLNKMRSLLTMLGVIIGVGAVIAMLSLGTAFGELISGQISGLGTNVLFIRAGQFRHGPMSSIQTLVPEDAEAILNIEGVRSVTPVSINAGPVKAGNKTNNTAPVWGLAPSLGDIQNVQMQQGRMFNDSEVRRQARVAVLGPKTAADIFGEQDPIGSAVRIRNLNFRVIGVTKPLGDQGGFNPDDRALIPYTTAMRQLPPRRDFVQTIMVSTFDKESIGPVIKDITSLLRQRHRLRPDAADDFAIQNMAEILETFQKVSFYLTVFLGTVAAISLIVGGIGIMNIMLATVAERTREIGIRKALGAKNGDILRQFLIETLVITIGGGLLGLALGWGLMAGTAAAVNQWLKLSPMLQWWVVGMAVAVSTAVGLVSGIYPAWRASRLDPIVALRYE